MLVATLRNLIGRQTVLPPERKTMKILLPSILLVLAISFAVSTFAQDPNDWLLRATVDPEVRQQIEAVATRFVEAYN